MWRTPSRLEPSQGISVVGGAMQRHKDHADVQENACWALANLTFAVVENKKMVAEAGGVALIVNAMQQHPSEPFLQYCGCYALVNLAEDDDANKPLIVEQDGITVVLFVHCICTHRMRMFSVLPVKLWRCWRGTTKIFKSSLLGLTESLGL